MTAARLLTALIVLCTLTACSGGSESPGSSTPTTELIRGNGPEPDSLDPQKARTVLLDEAPAIR